MTPPPPPTPGRPPAGAPSPSLRETMAAAARARATRPKAILAFYAVLALIAVVSFLGQMFGWWKSPVAEKVLEQRRKAATPEPAPPSPTPPPTPPAMSD